MKKKIILLIVIIIYFVVCWKLPFYILLLGIDLPEDTIILKRQVSYTDVYNPHILAEIVFVSDLDYDNIRETIWKENRIIMGEILDFTDSHIMDREILREWDDYCISVKEIDELTFGIGNINWYYVSIEMPVIVFIFFRLIAVFMVISVICLASSIKRKSD